MNGRLRVCRVPWMAGVLAGLLFLGAAFRAEAAPETGASRLARAAAGVKAPPAGKDFTRIRPGSKYRAEHVLVRFATPGPGMPGALKTSAATRTRLLATMGGAKVAHEARIVPGLCRVKLPPGLTVEEAVARYNKLPGVVYAKPDYQLEAFVTPNDARFGELWGMPKIHAPEAWDICTGGSNAVVCVIDTGVDYNHEDLAANMWVNPGEIPDNEIDDDGNGYVDDIHGINVLTGSGDPMDDHNHGTHCSGTVGGAGNNGVGVAGVCWRVRIMGAKFLSASGSGWESDAVTCIEYAVAMGARVLSCSWGGTRDVQAVSDAIDAAGAAGVVVVAAAGNSFVDNDAFPHYPAAYEAANLITVLATDSSDVKATFSNYGQVSVDLAAPGVNILSCVRGGSYMLMSGTSMACPHVAGACALLLSYNPTLTVAELKEALLSSVDVPATPYDCVSGGRLNVLQALRTVGMDWVHPKVGCVFTGPPGGPFEPSQASYTLSNYLSTAVSWSLDNTASAWCDASPASGTLTSGIPVTVTVALKPGAVGLPLGLYAGSLVFSNLSDSTHTDRPFALAIVSAPELTTQPTNQAVLWGQAASFTVGTESNALQYFQWRRDGTNLTEAPLVVLGAASHTWTVADASPADEGIYDVVVSNAMGVVTSATATLAIVSSAPVITQQPVSRTGVLPGYWALYSAAAVGDRPYGYQWRLNGTNLTEGGVYQYEGSDSDTLRIGNISAAIAGNYSVVVSNAVGATTSSNAALGVTSIEASGVLIERLYAFPGGVGGATPSRLAQGPDGNLYGTCIGGLTSSYNSTYGMVFRATLEGEVTTLALFDGSNGAVESFGVTPPGLTLGADGNFYGVMRYGGANGYGTVYRVTPAGDLTVLHSFQGAAAGQWPSGELLLAADGSYYGICGGGATGQGAIFRITPGGVYTLLVSFDGALGGPSHLIQGKDGFLYGSKNGGDKAYRVSTNGVLTVLATIPTSVATSLRPLVQDSDGILYGYGRGANYKGSVFKLALNGTATALYAFPTSGENGTNPDGAPLLGADGNLYGSTSLGGTYGRATIVRTAPRGGSTVVMVQLDGYVGNGTRMQLIQGADGRLYGTALGGPTPDSPEDYGVIVRITMDGAPSITSQPASQSVYAGAEANLNVAVFGRAPMLYRWRKGGVPLTDDGRIAGSTNRTLTLRNISAADAASYSVVVSNALGQVTSGNAALTVASSAPVIIRQPTNAGTVLEGAAAGFDVLADGNPPLVYRWRLNGTNLTDGGRISGAGTGSLRLTGLIEADSGAYSCLVSNPVGSTVSSSAALTVIPVVASGYAFSTVHMFSTSSSAGYWPRAGLLQAPDGRFCGTTTRGGASDYGAVFGMTPEGTVGNLGDFDHVTTGSGPNSPLVVGPDGSFYGTAPEGGSTNSTAAGAVFRVTPDGVLTGLCSFFEDGEHDTPSGLMLYSDGNFYGTTAYGRNDGSTLFTGHGSVFRMSPGGAVTTVHVLNKDTEGRSMAAGLLLAADGFLYGGTLSSAASYGTIFRLTPGGAFTPAFANFSAFANKSGPKERLIEGTDGNFYGTTSGGATIYGMVFRMTPAGAVTSLASFDYYNSGRDPQGALVQGPEGNLYGTTRQGGLGGYGTVFRVDPDTRVLTTLVYFSGPNGHTPNADLILGADGCVYGTTLYGGDAWNPGEISGNGNGTVFRLTLPSGEVTNHTLQVESAWGTPTPPVGTCSNAYGVVLTNWVASPVLYGSTTQYVCTGWTMSGHEPLSGSSNQFAMAVTNDAVLTWLWETQYWLNATAVTNGGAGK